MRSRQAHHRPVFVLACAALQWLALTGLATAQRPTAPPATDGQCTVLACDRCGALCDRYCEASAAECTKAGKRGCPRVYRSCTRSCRAELCVQCLPTQYGTDGKVLSPGRTELCRVGAGSAAPR